MGRKGLLWEQFDIQREVQPQNTEYRPSEDEGGLDGVDGFSCETTVSSKEKTAENYDGLSKGKCREHPKPI